MRELIEIGTKFDRTSGGDIALTREGGHHRDRIAHAGGDATGLEIERALIAALHAEAGIEVLEHALVLDLLRAADGRVAGAHPARHRRRASATASARCARGPWCSRPAASGRSSPSTTNPSVSTGDGVALALRAGAASTDLEFVQFHPTVLWLGDGLARASSRWCPRRCAARAPCCVDDDGEPLHAGRCTRWPTSRRATSSPRRS